MVVQACPPPQPVTLGVVVFVPADFRTQFPSFATLSDMQLQMAFDLATLQLTNSCCSRVKDSATLVAIIRAWRPSLVAGFMGAFASQMWFLAFALETAAKVRTLALVEILFAQVVSRNLFKQSLASREAVGIALIIAGVVLLLNL